MTPEQKAFFEYGKARLHVENARDILKEAILDCNLGFGIIRDFKHEIFIYKSAIRSAWNARKECRKWVPLKDRTCSNCLHNPCPPCMSPCLECNNESHWQPRKD